MSYKKWYKFIFYFLLLGLMVIFQITFLGGLNLFWANFNLVLAGLVVLVALADFNQALVYAVLAGVMMDVYSSLPFGIFLAVLFILAIILEILFLNFFTNRSFYSLIIMGLIAVLIYHLLFFIISGLFYLTGVSEFFGGHKIWLALLYQLADLTILLALVFWVLNKISKRFKPTFIQT